MKFSPYSTSRINLYKQCPRKFKYAYIENAPQDAADDYHLKKGFMTHLLLENHAFPLGKERIKKEIQNEEISETVIRDAKTIYKNFIKTELGKEIFSYFPVGAEVEVGLKIEGGKIETCEFSDPKCFFRGKIDYICVDRGSDKVKVIDWKTGKDRSSGSYTMSPDQLMYYAVWYFNNFPVDEIEIMYVFVEHGTKLNHILKRESLNEYTKMLLKNIKEIESDVRFEKNEGPLCNYCSFKTFCQMDPIDIKDKNLQKILDAIHSKIKVSFDIEVSLDPATLERVVNLKLKNNKKITIPIESYHGVDEIPHVILEELKEKYPPLVI